MDRIEITRTDGTLRILRNTVCDHSTREETLPAPTGVPEIRCIVHTIRLGSKQAWLHRAAAEGGPVQFRVFTDDSTLEVLDLLVTPAGAGSFILEGREAI